MVFVPNSPFFNLYLLLNLGKENVFYDILDRKNALLGYKNKKFKSRKIEIFPKGLVHGFCPKIDHFSMFFFIS